MSLSVCCRCQAQYEIPLFFRGYHLQCPQCKLEFVLPRRTPAHGTYHLKAEDITKATSDAQLQEPGDIVKALQRFCALQYQLLLAGYVWLDLVSLYRALGLMIKLWDCRWQQQYLNAVLGARLVWQQPAKYFQQPAQLQENFQEFIELKKEHSVTVEQAQEEEAAAEKGSGCYMWFTRRALLKRLRLIGALREHELQDEKFNDIKGEQLHIQGQQAQFSQQLKILGQGSRLVAINKRIISWTVAFVLLLVISLVLKILFFLQSMVTFFLILLFLALALWLIWPSYRRRRDFSLKWQRDIDRALNS